MVELDREALAHAKSNSRDRKLNSAEKLAIYAFTLEGVPAKILARLFDVRANAIYYIANWEHTAAHQSVKDAFNRLGKERVWSEVITEEQTERVNADLQALMKGNKIHDRRHRRINRRGPRPGRTGATSPVPEAASDGASGSAEAAQRVPG
jgi:hypothetical protein